MDFMNALRNAAETANRFACDTLKGGGEFVEMEVLAMPLGITIRGRVLYLGGYHGASDWKEKLVLWREIELNTLDMVGMRLADLITELDRDRSPLELVPSPKVIHE